MTNSTAEAPVALDHPQNRPLTIQTVYITPELAQEWLGSNTDNRNKRAAHVRNLARDMTEGRWQLTGDAIRFDWNGRLIDGQHRLEAVILSGVTIGSLVIHGLPPHAREVIDTNAKRSSADALRFNGFEYDPMQLAAVARLAIARSRGGFTNALSSTPSGVTNSEVIAWAQDHPEVEHALALSRRTVRQIGIQPSVWGYALWEFQQIDAPVAIDFATSIADRRTDGKGDPRYALLDTFHRAALGRRRMPGQAESLYIAFRAWNAWVTGKRVANFIPTDKDGTGNAIPALVAPTN